MTIRFDNKVAIVTGAAHGLGRSHALELARRGAKVVINDVGGDVSGVGHSESPAEKVVQEIKALGSDAISHNADVSNVEQVQDMVDKTLAAFGRVDILINNAGILRDKSFTNMTVEDFIRVMEVHVYGSMICTKAVWPIMREQSYGRILMTSSPSGLYGSFGQANYSTAKLGLVGFMNTLHHEGLKYNIHTNSIAPIATTRMTQDLLPEQFHTVYDPKYVTAGVIYLVSDDVESGIVLELGAGSFSRIYIVKTPGVVLKPDETTPENVAANWDKICDHEGEIAFRDSSSAMSTFMPQVVKNFGIE